MAIEFEHDGRTFKADTPAEAITLLKWLTRRDEAALKQKVASAIALSLMKPAENGVNPWTSELFAQFIGRLKDQQITVLRILHEHKHGIDDVVLRHALSISNNQVLAGILSGLSKQATAAGISPRDVFWVENFRSQGRRSSRYHVAGNFLDVANETGWPPGKNEPEYSQK